MNIDLRNRTIFTKILSGFVLLLVLAALMGGVLFYSLRDVTGVLRQITERNAPSIRYPTGVERYALRTILDEKNYLLFGKKEIHEQAMQDIREIYANLDRVDQVAIRYNDQVLLRKSGDVRGAVEEYQGDYNQGVALLKENQQLEHKMRILGRKANNFSHTHTLVHKRLLEEATANGIDQAKHMQAFHVSTEIEKEVLEARRQEKNYIIYKNEEHIARLREHIANFARLLHDETDKFTYDFEHKAQMEEIGKATDQYLEAAEKWVANDKELSEILGEMHEIGVKVQETALAVQEAGWQEMDMSKESAVQSTEKASLTGILVAALTLIIGIVLAFFIARGIAGPIKGLTLTAAGIAKGDLSRRAAVKGRDEVGKLAISFNTMVENLQNTMVSRDYFDNIIKSMIDTLIVVDPEAKIITVNPATCHLLGYTGEDLMGRPVSIIFAEEEEEEEVRRMFQFFREPEKAQALDPQDSIRNRELTYKAKDGRLIPMSFNASILTDEAGNVTAVVAGAKDITDIKLAEAEIRKEKNFSQNIITTIPDSLLVLDKDLRIKSVNLSFYKVFGLEPEKVIGARITDILGDEDGRLTARLTRVFGTEEMLEDFELRYQPVFVPACADEPHPDTQGTGRSEKPGERILNIRARNIIIAEEEEEEELVVIQDVTHRRRAEEKLKEYSGRLEEMVEERTLDLRQTRDRLVEAEKLRALGLMASGVAHEFNNLLAVVLGNTQLLKMDLSGEQGKEIKELSEQAREMLDTIERAASDGAETVRRIQEYTRIRKDKFHTPTDLNDIIENSVEFLRPRWKDEADKKKITINVRTSLSDIPPILGNESELREVMTNLIINSIDAMPDGGDINIRTGRDGENVKVTIEDTGIGISKENAAKVFDPFFSTKDFKGTGLGLSVSYGIVKRHDGKIALESVPGKGTTFILTFPAAHETEEKEKEEASPRTALKKAKILIIDDEESVRDVLSRMLSAMGHEVEVAMSGREGLTLFHRAMESIPFDLVFTDLGMPEMNGWEVAGEIKKVRPTTPVALITGWGLEVDRDEMKKQGVDLIIAKPFNMGAIAGLVDEAMLLET